jgi:sucrose phosphorylase
MDLLARTGVGRDINRHRYGPGEVEAALARPVVQELCALIRLRNTHPAFAGRCSVEEGGEDRLVLAWREGRHVARLEVDFGRADFAVEASDP